MTEINWSDNLKKLVKELKQLEPEELEKRINDPEYLASKSITAEESSALQNIYTKAKSEGNVEGVWS